MSSSRSRIMIVVVLSALFVMVSCGGQAPETELATSGEADAPSADVTESEAQEAEPAPEEMEEAEEATKPLKLAVQVLTTEIEYFEELRQAYIASAEEKGYEIVTSDAQSDPAVQVSFIEDQVAAGVDVIILSIVDAATAQPAIEDAIAQGVPVIVQGQEEEDFPWSTANVGYNEEAMGTFAGDLVAACLAEKFPDVETYNGVSCTWPDWPSTQRRDAAAKVAVEQAGEVNWVLEQKCGTREWGLEVVEAALVSEPDLHFVVGVNDASSIGAVAAFESAGLDPTAYCIAGPNNDREVRQYVADGRVYGTVDLNVEGLAAAAIDLAGQIGAGQDVPKMTYVDMIPVTIENIGGYSE